MQFDWLSVAGHFSELPFKYGDLGQRSIRTEQLDAVGLGPVDPVIGQHGVYHWSTH